MYSRKDLQCWLPILNSGKDHASKIFVTPWIELENDKSTLLTRKLKGMECRITIPINCKGEINFTGRTGNFYFLQRARISAVFDFFFNFLEEQLENAKTHGVFLLGQCLYLFLL